MCISLVKVQLARRGAAGKEEEERSHGPENKKGGQKICSRTECGMVDAGTS